MDSQVPQNGRVWTPEITNQHIVAARAGSLESWTSIALNTERIPIGRLTEVLNLFIPIFVVLDSFDPSAPLPDPLKPRYERVRLALRGIAMVGSRVMEVPDFLRILSSSWPDIIKWAQYYFNVKCTSDGGTHEVRTTEAGALALLTSLFGIFSMITDGYSIVGPGCRDFTFELLAKTWLKLVPNTSIDALPSSPRALTMTQMQIALKFALDSPNWSLSSARNIILREAGNQPTLVARVALTAIRDAPSFQRETSYFVRNSLPVIFLLLRLGNPKDGLSVFHKALIDKHVIRLVIQTMSHFSSSPNNNHEASLLIAMTSMEIITTLMELKDAYALLPRIIKTGILDALANLIEAFYAHGNASNDLTRPVIKHFLGNLLPTYLVHYPVLSTALQATNSLILSKKINVYTSSSFRSEWELFFDLLLDRAAVKALYDLMLKAKDHLVCHNCGISSKQSGKKLSACSGCKTTLYCSHDCQKAAWTKKNHKLECEAWKELINDKYFHLHSTLFSPHLVAHDMRRHLPGVLKLCTSNPEFRDAGSDIGYAISYVSQRAPFIEISLFRASSVTDGKTFTSAESSEISSIKFKHAFDRLHNAKGLQMVHVEYHRGGGVTANVFEGLLQSDFEMPANAVIGGPTGMSNPRRRKARDKQGRELETVWDNVDDIMFNALKEEEEANVNTNSIIGETVFDRIVRLAKEHVDNRDMSRPISPD